MSVTTGSEAVAGHVASKPSVAWVLASLALCMLLPSLGTSIANVALPTLAEAFDASFQNVQWVVLAYLLATTSLIVSAGRLGDIIGRRRLLMVGIALFTAASTACGFASELWVLIAARGTQGLGAAIMMALTMAFVGEAIPKSRTGRAMGLLGTMSAVGTALGPSLGGVLIKGFGWPSIFFVNVPLGVLALILVARNLPADRRASNDRQPRFDHVGTLLLALTLAAYALAMTTGRGHFGGLNAALLLATAIGIGLFVLAETKARSPLIRLAGLRDRALSAGLVTSALVSTVIMATLVVGPFYLSGALALDTAMIGWVMSLGPAAAALTGVPAGRLVDRFGSHRMTAGALVGMVAGCAALCAAPVTLGITGYVIPIVAITASYALFQTANNTGVMSNVAADQRGAISGLLNLSRNLGLITGASAMGAMFAMASGTVDLAAAHPEALSEGLRATFAVAAALLVVALVLAVRSQARAQSIKS
ncbi:MAG: MFS transporter [Panacagrimonas sp.]